MLFLFQVIAVQLAFGSYHAPIPRSPAQAVPIAFETKSHVVVQSAGGLPVNIKIPSIRVNALIQKVGLAPDGSMDVPKAPRDTAWYMLGPKPGEIGSAVISGHVNWLHGATGVFERLDDIKPGDTITIQTDTGASTSFVVRETRMYGPDQDASDVFGSSDGKSHLNLVTCAGVWDKKANQYTKRLVVFADKKIE